PQPMIRVDTETTGLGRDASLCGFSLAWQAGHAVYVPIRSPEPESHLSLAEVLTALGPLLEDESLPKCGHNLKFDARVLLREGGRLRGVVFDSMLASALIDPSQASHSLDHLALGQLNYRMIPISDLIGSGNEQLPMDQVALDLVVPYAAEDADIALRLQQQLAQRLEEMGLAPLMRDVEAPLTTVLAE